jgi:hypothetical protein
LILLLGQFQLWGAWPAGYHAIALLLFAGTVALLGLLILTLTDSKGAALIGSLLFAIYPLHQEAIVYVSASVFDLHAGFWLLAALLSLARWLAAGTPGWAVATISAIGFALLAKEAALLSPVMLTAALWLWPRPHPKPGWRLGALAGAVWLVFVGLLLYRASCFGALKGTGLLYLNPSLLLASFVKFVSFHLFPTGLLGSYWEAAAALAATSVGVIALLGRKGNRLTLWWGTLAVLGALPVLGAISGNLADPRTSGGLIPALGISGFLGQQLVAFPPRFRALLTGILCAACVTLSVTYVSHVRPLANVTRSVLRGIERAAGDLGEGTVVVEGLPVAKWILAYACGPPFISIPDTVRVELSGPALPSFPGIPDHVRRRFEPLPGRKMTLRWNSVTERLEPS